MKAKGPEFIRFFKPILQILKQSGGSGTTSEVIDRTIELLQIPESEQEITLKNGAVQQTNFNNYQVVRMNEAPKIEVYIIAEGGKPGGIGEPGTALIGPTVANAVAAATGKRLRKLPLRV